MSLDLSLVTAGLESELARIGLHGATVSIRQLDDSGTALIVTVVSPSFEGQTYLDREMRVRPAVARELSRHGHARLSYIVRPHTPEELNTAENEPPPDDGTIDEAPDEERANRSAWRDQIGSILKAMEASGYTIEPIDKNALYVAERAQLAHERILLAFALSPSAKSIDVSLRKKMQSARSSQTFSAHYYIVPHELSAPYATGQADWLRLTTGIDFLHVLNSSFDVSKRLAAECQTALELKAKDSPGDVVEPDIRVLTAHSVTCRRAFFEYVQRWLSTPGPSLLVIMAPAGHGKTTLTLELARRFATAFTHEHKGRVPLLVPFESVRRTVDFEALMHKRFAELRTGTLGAFKQLLRCNEAILLVDGFDELADDAGVGAAEHQVRSMQPLFLGKAKVILAGRSVFTQQFAGEQDVATRVRSLLGDIDVQVLELMEFSEEQISAYTTTRRNLAPDRQRAVLSFASATPDHQDLCANPLFLGILCSLAASGKLPARHEVALGVDILIEKICEREEERQQLGIGASGQRLFLEWLALDLFRSGGRTFATADVQAAAATVAESLVASDPQIAGRLADHALLVPAEEHSVTFIHPLIRDVIIGHAIEESAGKPDGLVGLNSTLAIHDLPEGTVHYVARPGSFIQRAMPDKWLSDAGSLPPQTRRNLFRIAARSAKFRSAGNPRDWVAPSWISAGVIRSLDCADLAIDSISFDGLNLLHCKMSFAFIQDCDFRSSSLQHCDLTSTTFEDCRADASTRIEGSIVVDTELRVRGKTYKVSTPQELTRQVRMFGGGGETKEISTNVAERCRTLVSLVLSQLVDPVQKQFFSKHIDAIRPGNLHGREQVAVDKVIRSAVVSALCDVDYTAGSRETVTVTKRWRSAVVDFVSTGHISNGLESVVSKIAVRAARYLA